ncbi:hypothetical protein CCH79_00010386 [Gambusia affinis]|uniref:Dickkopf N-terminal cysteine-rich domain-containing protein n=1 Tax=Gambusia affinis TaxID=33528 RepID=A0A315V1H7_GAMAF|nr:hypothetical protein CCH79_00010386 [Gambusia affinis]
MMRFILTLLVLPAVCNGILPEIVESGINHIVEGPSELDRIFVQQPQEDRLQKPEDAFPQTNSSVSPHHSDLPQSRPNETDKVINEESVHSAEQGTNNITATAFPVSDLDNSIDHGCMTNDDCGKGKYCLSASKCKPCKDTDVMTSAAATRCVCGVSAAKMLPKEKLAALVKSRMTVSQISAVQFIKPIERERCFDVSNNLMELLSWDMQDNKPRKHCPCAGELQCQHLGEEEESSRLCAPSGVKSIKQQQPVEAPKKPPTEPQTQRDPPPDRTTTPTHVRMIHTVDVQLTKVTEKTRSFFFTRGDVEEAGRSGGLGGVVHYTIVHNKGSGQQWGSEHRLRENAPLHNAASFQVTAVPKSRCWTTVLVSPQQPGDLNGPEWFVRGSVLPRVPHGAAVQVDLEGLLFAWRVADAVSRLQQAAAFLLHQLVALVLRQLQRMASWKGPSFIVAGFHFRVKMASCDMDFIFSESEDEQTTTQTCITLYQPWAGYPNYSDQVIKIS